MRVMILKPAIDTKGQDSIVSRLGICCKVDQLVTPRWTLRSWSGPMRLPTAKLPACFAMRASFFTPEHCRPAVSCHGRSGHSGHLLRLRADFMMRGFPGSTRLLEIAHTIEELKTIWCTRETDFGSCLHRKMVFQE